MEKKILDVVLVPTGLVIMIAYHLWLLYQIVKHPTKTVIGVNSINRRLWVQAMMEVHSYGNHKVLSFFLSIFSIVPTHTNNSNSSSLFFFSLFSSLDFDSWDFKATMIVVVENFF